MAARKIELITPNNLKIIGARLEDGSISKFEFTYDSVNSVFDYLFPNNLSANILKQDGQSVLVDSDDNEWPASDIEFHSII